MTIDLETEHQGVLFTLGWEAKEKGHVRGALKADLSTYSIIWLHQTSLPILVSSPLPIHVNWEMTIPFVYATELHFLDHTKPAADSLEEEHALHHCLHSLVSCLPRQERKPQKITGSSMVSLLPYPPLWQNCNQTHCLRKLPLPQTSTLEEGEKNYLLTVAPEDKEVLLILLAVAEEDSAIFDVFKVGADPCRDELNLCGEKWQSVTIK